MGDDSARFDINCMAENIGGDAASRVNELPCTRDDRGGLGCISLEALGFRRPVLDGSMTKHASSTDGVSLVDLGTLWKPLA